MHKSKKAKVLAALSVAAAVGTYGHVNVAKAVMLTQSYNNAIIGATSTFASTTTLSLNQANPQITLTVGESFEFGMGDVLTNNSGTGNVNPASGTQWDTVNQSANGASPIAPNLGLATLAYTINSSDATGVNLQPILSTDQHQTDPNNNNKEIFNSTATIGTFPTAPSGKNPGNAETNDGVVGTGPVLSADWSPGSISGNLDGPGQNSGSNLLADFSGNSTSAFTTLFTKLRYNALTAGTVTLTPQVSSQGTSYWLIDTSGPNNGLGSTSNGNAIANDPTYKSQNFTTGDTVVALAPLVITILGTGPTGPTITLTSGNVAPPAGLSQLLNGASSAQHGQFTPSSGNVLTVTGSSGNYLKGTVNNIGPSAAGDNKDYVQVGGFSPSSDKEIYALKLDQSGTALAPSSAAIATIVADINAANDSTFGVTQLASTAAQEASSNAGAAALFSGYDVFLTIPTAYLSGLTNGTGFNFNFGFNFSGYTDGAVSNITVTDIGLVPEPGAMLGVLSLGAVGMFSYRRRKPEVAKA